MSLIVKIIVLGLPSVLSLPFAHKTQYFVYLSFNSILHLINDISNDLQKLLRYFIDTAVIAFLKIPFAWFEASWTNVFPNNLAL